MASCSANDLAAAAKGFSSMGGQQLEWVKVHLLCQILKNSGGGTVCASLSGAGSPVGIHSPSFIGQLYHNTTNDTYWRSTGLTNADWTQISGGVTCNGLVWGPNATTLGNIASPMISDAGITYSFPTLTSVNRFDFHSDPVVTSISFPSLTSIGDFFDVDSCPLLTTLSLPVLTSAGANGIDIDSCPNLATVNLQSLVSIAAVGFYGNDCTSLVLLNLTSLVSNGGPTIFNGCTSLTTVTVPNWIPSDPTTIRFDNCALLAASVNQILARCVASGMVASTIDLSGGTNAAPTGQGIIDKAALIAAGNSCVTN